MKKVAFPILLVLIVFLLAWTNYLPNTWLSGWDTLHPEFNLGLYLERIFWGVWQQHQGLGAVASQAHAAELSRMVLYLPLSLLLPANLVRFVYFFLMLEVGTLGSYFFLEKIILNKLHSRAVSMAAFLGALLYLLNLGTLQIFYIPFEMFATMFAFLPWLLLFASKYLEQGERRPLVGFLILSFLSGSVAHTSTLFWAYLVILGIYSGVILVFLKSKKGWLRLVFLLGGTILVNLYWILPNLYFIFSHGNEVVNSKINLQFSDQAFDKGKLFSNALDLSQLKNYLFDWGQYDSSQQKFVQLFSPWTGFLNTWPIIVLRIALATLALVGGVVAIVKRQKFSIAILVVSLISIAFIGNDLPIIANFYSLIRDHSSLLREALRFPFTKFSPFLILGYSVLFAVGVEFFLDKLLVINWNHKFKTGIFMAVSLAMALGIMVTMLPAFQGQFIDKKMESQIPGEYFSMFSWFDQQPMGRIAAFPVNSFWGWNYYRWNYEGAGFIWFGIKQPILLREFDKWNSLNENYYWEVSQAVYSKDINLLEKVLQKYQVNWLLVDENIVDPASPKSTYTLELEELLGKSGRISLTKSFGKLKIYSFENSSPSSSFAYVLKNPVTVSPKYGWTEIDEGYQDLGNYLSGGSDNPDAYYPFRSLFSDRNLSESEFVVSESDQKIVFSKELPIFVTTHQLGYQISPQDRQISFNKKGQLQEVNPEVKAEEKNVTVTVPRGGSIFSRQFNAAEKSESLSETNCDPTRGGTVRSSLMTETMGKTLQIVAKNANNCLTFAFPDLPHNYGYLVTVENKNVSGKPILFWLENLNSRRLDLEVNLSKKRDYEKSQIIVPPMENDGVGYSLHFDVSSIGPVESEDYLKSVSIEPIPYRLLKSMKLASANLHVNSQLQGVNVKQVSESVYEISTSKFAKGDVLTLSQAFEPGWQAYEVDKSVPWILSPVFGQKIGEHVLVNNWENGWTLDSFSEKLHPPDGEAGLQKTKIVILFWPQYLEFIGFAALGVLGILGAIVYIKRSR